MRADVEINFKNFKFIPAKGTAYVKVVKLVKY